MATQECPSCGVSFVTSASSTDARCPDCRCAPSDPIAALRASSHILGETKINGHCTFQWTEPVGSGPRVYELEPHHCADCIAELGQRTNAVMLKVSHASIG